jgi:hypothetical protein
MKFILYTRPGAVSVDMLVDKTTAYETLELCTPHDYKWERGVTF